MASNVNVPISPENLRVFETLPYNCLILAPDFRILNASNAYLKLVGKTRGELLGRNVYDVFDQNPNWIRSLDAGMGRSMQLALESGERQEMQIIQLHIPDWASPGKEAKESYWKISHTPVLNDAGEPAYLIHDIDNVTEQVIYEQRLQESLESEKQAAAKSALLSRQMQQLFEIVPAQIAIVTGPDFVYEYVNPQYKNELFPNREVLGLPALEALPEIASMPVWNIVQQVYKEHKTFVETEIEIRLADEIGGQLKSRYFNLIYQPHRDEYGNVIGVLSFKYEITGQVQARKDLEMREQELVEITEKLSQTNEELMAANEEMSASNEELNSVNEQLEETNEQLQQAHEQLVALNEELEERVQIRTRELMSLQAEAEGQAQRLRFLLNAIPQQVWTTNPEGKLIAVNDILCKDLGYSADEILEIGLTEFAHPEDLPQIYKKWQEALHSGQEYSAEYRLRFADGVYRWHLGRAVPMIENGEVSFWLGTNTNIDVQKENERRKDEFLSIASHELKTPLTSIKSFNQLMNRVRDGQQLGLYIQKSYHNILRLEKLINDLLDVTKINAGKLVYNMEPFDFLQMVRETIENVQITVSSHEIILTCGESFEYTGDRMRMEQLLINLLDNAIKYSPGGEEVLVRVSLENEHIIVCVQDYGVGIEKSHLIRLFDRYYRSDNTAMRFEGLGLGLYISAEIVRRHSGTYWLESEPGRGSSFYFRLPLNPDQAIESLIDERQFYKDDQVTILYNTSAHQLEAVWTGHQNAESVRRGGLKILELIRYNKVRRLLNDNTHVLGNWSEASEWVAKDLMVSLQEAGLRYIAWIQSKSAIGRLAAEKMADMASKDIEMQFFNNLPAADAWLKSKY